MYNVSHAVDVEGRTCNQYLQEEEAVVSPAHLAVDCEFYKSKQDSRILHLSRVGVLGCQHQCVSREVCRSRKLMEENDIMRELSPQTFNAANLRISCNVQKSRSN